MNENNVNKKPPKIIGILGGMGPEATNYLYHLIIINTPAKKDQDHIKTIIFSDTSIPDRTTCILNNEHQEIIKKLKDSAKILENSGADLLIIPCNTAHYYIDNIQKAINIPIIDMLKITADFMKNSIFQEQKNTSHNRIGLLATTGTIKTEVYQKRFEKVDLDITIPDEKSQDEIMEIIYRIKEKGNSKEIRNEILEIVDHFRKNNNLNWVILGCTELPLPFQEKQDFNDLKLINPMQILAEKVVGIIKKGITL